MDQYVSKFERNLDGNRLLPRGTGSQHFTNYRESDLSFLDPKREQEVQTLTDFIY